MTLYINGKKVTSTLDKQKASILSDEEKYNQYWREDHVKRSTITNDSKPINRPRLQ